MKPTLFHLLVVACVGLAFRPCAAAEPIEFARDILPILSANCYACHGPDEADRQAGLRLDLPEQARRAREAGTPVVPGQPALSLVMQRIETADPDLRMPPPSSNKSLKPAQVELLRRWIEAGAEWQQHWSFAPLAPRAGKLDDHVRAGLAPLGLDLRPRAAPQTLVRRLSLDLLGLPPERAWVEEFAADSSDAAWDRLVDRVLASPAFGEHWARMWLDLSRYADTKGYEKDLGRTMWPWRDWVVRALNDDLPLDRFTRLQLAADLDPTATTDDLIATAFHRNTMSNDEGGTDDEEFRVAAVKDRVDTTVQVWMGLTMGCAKCHSHKYDPLSQTDYYRLFAIFNQTEDADRFDDHPRLELPSADQQCRRDEVRRELEQRQAELTAAREQAKQADEAAAGPWRKLDFERLSAAHGTELKQTAEGVVEATGPRPEQEVYTFEARLAPGRQTALRLDALTAPFPDGQVGVGRNSADPNFVLSELRVERRNADGTYTPIELVNARADYSQPNWPVAAALDGDTKTGWAVSPRSREQRTALFDLKQPLELTEPTSLRFTLAQHYGQGLVLARVRLRTSGEPVEKLTLPDSNPAVTRLQETVAALQKSAQALAQEIDQLPVLKELPSDRRRATHLHKRGNFRDLGEEVAPGLPAGFGPRPPAERPTRVDVATWLVNADNPLTPRVWANRVWARLQGVGLVETEEDFGALGSWPVNRPLLDWLAASYRDGGWSLKRLIREIVRSEAYRQSSVPSEAALAADPQNRWLSRGPRYRLSAEVIRDQALAVGGLLSDKVGGPPVMPPQPAGLWRSTYNGRKWIDAEGPDRYRRGLYTYLKRTTPYPSLVLFDGGSGEVCQVRRIRTNTPLQALVTLNDPVYLEAAGGLARRMLAGDHSPAERLRTGLQLALQRPVDDAELAPLLRLWQKGVARFQAAPAQATALLETSRFHATGPLALLPASDTPPKAAAPVPKNAPIDAQAKANADAQSAAWVLVASTILNLDEFLTRP